ncbi:hypothetical protein CYMTET_23503, partial [Cymbomonas tetramitiformis]
RGARSMLLSIITEYRRLMPRCHVSVQVQAVKRLKEEGKTIVALETVAEQQDIYSYRFPQGCALLLGNERHGIEADLLEECDAIVRIPCCGNKNSLNVGVSMAVCCYEMSRQWSSMSASEDVGQSLLRPECAEGWEGCVCA